MLLVEVLINSCGSFVALLSKNHRNNDLLIQAIRSCLRIYHPRLTGGFLCCDRAKLAWLRHGGVS